MRNNGIGRVEDYTDAFLCVVFLLLMVTLILIWDAWGYAAPLLLCAALHWTIKRLSLRRARIDADWDARVAAALDRAYRR